MKNRVLRLAIVAILVVAMVLSMAACDKKPVETQAPATQAPKTQEPVAPATKAPEPEATVAPEVTPAPVVNTDEADLEAKYGIVFEVKDDLVFGEYGDGNTSFTFTANLDNVTDLYKAIGATNITIAVESVSAIDFEGEDVDDLTYSFTAGTVKATDAGTYVVEYSVTVVAGETTYGFYTTPEVDEEYTVTKTYTIAKKDVDVKYTLTKTQGEKALVNYNEVVASADLTGSYFAKPALVIADADAETAYNDMTASTADEPISVSVDILSIDYTKAGLYTLPYVFEVDGETATAADFVHSNYNFKFVEPQFAVLTADEESQRSEMEESIIKKYTFSDGTEYTSPAAGAITSTQVGVDKVLINQYNALSDSVKLALTSIVATAGNDVPEAIADFKVVLYNDARSNLVTEANNLYKAYEAALQSNNTTAATKAIYDYFTALSTDKENDAKESDFDFVKNSVTVAGTGINDAYDVYQDVIEKVVGDYNTAYGEIDDVDYIKTGSSESDYTAANLKKYETAVVAAEAKFALIPTDYAKAQYTTDSNTDAFADEDAFKALKNQMTAARTAYDEAAARFNAFQTVLAGLDSYLYTDESKAKATYAEMEELVGYNFDASTSKTGVIEFVAVTVGTTSLIGCDSASEMLMNTAKAPVYYLQEVADAYKMIVDAYVALDEKIVAEQDAVQVALASNIEELLESKGGCVIKLTSTATDELAAYGEIIKAATHGVKDVSTAAEDGEIVFVLPKGDDGYDAEVGSINSVEELLTTWISLYMRAEVNGSYTDGDTYTLSFADIADEGADAIIATAAEEVQDVVASFAEDFEVATFVYTDPTFTVKDVTATSGTGSTTEDPVAATSTVLEFNYVDPNWDTTLATFAFVGIYKDTAKLDGSTSDTSTSLDTNGKLTWTAADDESDLVPGTVYTIKYTISPASGKKLPDEVKGTFEANFYVKADGYTLVPVQQ